MLDGELIGYTSDLAHLVFKVNGVEQRIKVSLTADFADTVTELLEAREVVDLPGVIPKTTRMLEASPEEVKRATLKKDRQTSRLTPKAIQDRLRAGDSPESVAMAANTSVDHVLRWYEPVKSEQLQVIDIVRGSVQERASIGYSAMPIGEAVNEHLMLNGIDMESVKWSAAKAPNRSYWVVSLHYHTPSGKSSRMARWECDPREVTVKPRDEHARELGWVDGGSTKKPAPLSQREALGITPTPSSLLVSSDPGGAKLLMNPPDEKPLAKPFTSPRGIKNPEQKKRPKYEPFKNYEPARPPSPRRPIGD